MNENAKKWVKALRSGKYKQAKKHLRTRDGFCCLGVACDLAKKELGKKWEGNYFDGKEDILPDSVRNWLGLADGSGSYGVNQMLAQDNDNGVSFDNIANIIEEEFDTLFIE